MFIKGFLEKPGEIFSRYLCKNYKAIAFLIPFTSRKTIDSPASPTKAVLMWNNSFQDERRKLIIFVLSHCIPFSYSSVKIDSLLILAFDPNVSFF